MTEPPKLFIALRPSRAALDGVAERVEGLDLPRHSVVAASDWHITLAFIGDQPVDRVPAAAETISLAAHGVRSFGLRLRGGGNFGRTLWIDVDGDLGALRELTSRVRSALRAARIGFDPKPFVPHLTVARTPRDVDDAGIAARRQVLNPHEGPLWTVDRVRLYRSRPQGHPRYEELTSTRLTTCGEDGPGR